MEKMSACNWLRRGERRKGAKLGEGGKKKKQAGIMALDGRFVSPSSRVMNERLRQTQLKPRQRGADSPSLRVWSSAMPQRPRRRWVSFSGSSDRAGRAGPARQPTQKTSTVTGFHEYARIQMGLRNARSGEKSSRPASLTENNHKKNERRQMRRNLTCQVKQLMGMCRVL